MNGLTLRISCDKKIKPIKKDVQKEDVRSLLVPNFSSQLGVFEKLLSATSVEEQVQAIKEIFSSVSSGNSDYNHSVLVIDALVHLFLSIKPKSPLSPPLLKFLSALPEKYTSTIENCAIDQLSKKLQNEKLSVDEVSEYSLALQLCLDNKRSLNISLSRCLPLILAFLGRSLREIHNLFQHEVTPIKKLAIINAIHSCVQVGISICQQYEIEAQPVLNSVVIEVFSNPDLPIDTRAAAGVLAAHLCTTISPLYWIEVFQNIFNNGNELGVLSFCSGLLNVLTPKNLEAKVFIIGSENHVIKVIYRVIIDIEERNASESGIVLAATRCIVLLTKSLSNLPGLLNNEFIDSLLNFIWNHVEHYMDAVRHLAMSALFNIQSVAKSHPELRIFEKISKDIERMGVERRSKHAAISVLISHAPIESIISRSPGLVDALLNAALGNPSSNYAIKSLENLMEQDLKEQTDREKWFNLWVKPLLNAELSAPLEQILTTLLKIHPTIIQQIVSLGLDGNNKNIAVVLTCLKIGRKFNLLKGKDDDKKWKGLVDTGVLEKCMYHSQDDVRLSCFSLLIETSKSTEEFTSIEFKLIKIFLTYNFNNQEPSMRQKSLATCKKFLTRLRDSRAALIRKQYKNPRSDISSENITLVLEDYSKIVMDLQNMCLNSLFPGSSPARRSFAFGLLALIKELGYWDKFDQKSAQILLSCLLDSYEENKAIAKNLLSSMPHHLLNFEDKDNLEKYLNETMKLSSSIRPPDSISAAYYMSLLASYNDLDLGISMAYSTSYFCLSKTLEALSSDLKLARQSLLLAASSNPLYGHLFVIRHLLQDINLDEISVYPKWQSLISSIVGVAFECSDVVSNVVQNSSPEGHLPMDLTYCDQWEDSNLQVTSQMVLLCSWRTVKEVSLLLGELSEKAPISGDDKDVGLLNQKNILEIGEHLTSLLLETKHRGAFEQAYLGFSKLAARLWRCSSRELHELPRKWLDETLECISKNENLSATRRSAGIPFIVQALICSELDSGSCKTLQKTMVSLLSIAKKGSSEGRVHALNILRALYRGSSLGEAVGPYVADGIATAIAGFNSNTWAERNSSTLLLSALMSRVFGVPRGKSETLSWRNKMTGRLFFQRYPSLYEELLKHLEASSKNPIYPALYPVLLLLGRLYPSSLEGTDSNLQLLKYLPYVMQCSESSILKTRSLAATAVSSLISSASYIDFIGQLLDKLSETKNENHRHGLLLMVHKLIPLINSLEDSQTEKIKSKITPWTQTLLYCLTSEKSSYVCKDTSILIILQLILSFYEEMSEDKKLSIEKIVRDIILHKNLDDSVYHYGREMFYLHSSTLLLTLCFKNKNSCEFIQNTVNLLQNPNYEVFEVTLDILAFILSEVDVCFSLSINESLKLELSDSHFRNELREKIIVSKELANLMLKKIIEGENHHEDMVNLLKVLQYFPSHIHKFIKDTSSLGFLCKICKDSPPSVSCYAIKCLNTLLTFQREHGVIQEEDIPAICEVIEEFSNPEMPHDCREAVARLLSANFETLLQKSSLTLKLDLWCSGVGLLLDESGDIRRIICSELIGDVVLSRGLELFLQLFVDKSEMQQALTGLLSWTVGSRPLPENEKDDDSLFDKGPANTYFEELVLNRLACSHLETLARNNNILNLTIEVPYSKWLLKKTNIMVHSFNEVFDMYQGSIKFCDKYFQLLPYGVFENKHLLDMNKFENLLKVKSISV